MKTRYTIGMAQKDWKQQLLEIKQDMEKKEDRTLTRDQKSAETLANVLTQTIRLLKNTEKSGVIQSPILVTYFHLRKLGWQTLAKAGVGERVHGSYLLLTTPLFGIHADLVEKSPLGPVDTMLELFKCTEEAKTFAPSGHIRLKGNHYYTPLIKREMAVAKMLSIYDWDFAPNQLAHDIDISSVLDTVIARVIPAVTDIDVNIA